MRLIALLILTMGILIVFGDCGKKYPLPPEARYGMPPESSYVKVEGWPEGDMEFNDIRDIYIGVDGFLYIVDGNGIRRYYRNGVEVGNFEISNLEAPVAITQARDLTIFVVDSLLRAVFMYDLNGNLKGSFTDSLLTPGGIAVDDSMRIYVSDVSRDLVLVYDTLGNILDTLAGPGAGILNVDSPRGLYYFNGIIYIASTGHNWVEGITCDTPRMNVLHLGGTTHLGDTLEGYFIEPIDVYVDTLGAVYVVDYGNGRVQKFREDGVFIISTRTPTYDSDSLRPITCAVTLNGMDLFIAFRNNGTERVEKYTRPIRPGGGE